MHPAMIIFRDTLDGLNLIDHVDFDTNHMGNILDTILTTQESTLVINTKHSCLFSDHYLIQFEIVTNVCSYTAKEVAYHKAKNINDTSCAEDIRKSLADSDIQELDLDTIVALYNGTMSDVLDKHGPLKEKKVLDCPMVPWFNKSLSDEIRLKRRMKRSWQSDQKNTVK